jgi:hypothetical protein
MFNVSGPLTDPTAHRAWAVLMKRIGYARYVAQGGDWGAIITDEMGAPAPPELLGIPPTCPAPFHPTFPRHSRPTSSGLATRGHPGSEPQLDPAPRTWAERAYPNPIYFNEVDKGSHFAAWQGPELFTNEVRAAFRSLR